MAPEFLKLEVQNELFNPFMDLTKADIYSTALVLWELLNRTVGFFGSDAASVPEYQQPYDGMVQSEPTIPDMKRIVVDQRQRPPIPVIDPLIARKYRLISEHDFGEALNWCKRSSLLREPAGHSGRHRERVLDGKACYAAQSAPNQKGSHTSANCK